MNNTRPMKFVDLFCGAGGASSGFEVAGMKCVLAIDMDLLALATHKANHPSADHVLMDMTRPAIRWEKLRGQVDMVHGSPPCQNLSVANNNPDPEKALPLLRAFEDVVQQVRPRWFTMENVPQVRHHLNGLYPKVRVFNAANFGVPQTRRRVFAGRFPDPVPTHTKNGPQRTLTGDQLEPWVSFGCALGLEGYVNTGRDDYKQERESESPAPTVTGESGGQWKFIDTREIVLIPGSGTPGVGECRALPRTLLQPSHTVVVKPPKLVPASIKEGRAVGRLLIPEECAILQSFPSDYVFLGSKTARFRQIGNAVPPKMAEAIGRAIMQES